MLLPSRECKAGTLEDEGNTRERQNVEKVWWDNNQMPSGEKCTCSRILHVPVIFATRQKLTKIEVEICFIATYLSQF